MCHKFSASTKKGHGKTLYLTEKNPTRQTRGKGDGGPCYYKIKERIRRDQEVRVGFPIHGFSEIQGGKEGQFLCMQTK